jgi:hypothetical protein
LGTIPSPSFQRSFSFGESLSGFLQQEGLPFSSILKADKIAAVFNKYRSAAHGIYTQAILLWAFLSQVLRDGKEASCQSAVARVVSHLCGLGRPTPSSDTGDYCRARARLPEAALVELSGQIASQAEDEALARWLWKNRHAKLVDGFTFMMPDTPANQAVYPQHSAQKPGVGFPIARGACILSLATGCMMAAALGPYKGKQTGETALFRKLIQFLRKGDVVVADRYDCSYWMMALLMKAEVDVCFRNHQGRKSDFRKGKRLGKNDHLISWLRPKRPDWMTVEEYQSMPESIELRELRYTLATPGRKQQPFVVVTTMTQHKGASGVSYDEVAELYGFRWNAELDIRSIKTFLNLNHVRCKSPEMVHREFWTTILAYNLIRVTIATSASLHDKQPREISFVGSCQYVLASWQEVPHIHAAAALMAYCLKMLEQIAECRVGHRPGRIEPRVIKKRRDRYQLMTSPRSELRQRLLNGDNRFEG